MLFALHPIHTEAVTGVVGRAELLSALLCIGALLVLMSAVDRARSLPGAQQAARVLAALACAAAAMAAKETGFTVLGAFVLYELLAAALPPLLLCAGGSNAVAATHVVAAPASVAAASPPPTPSSKRGRGKSGAVGGAPADKPRSLQRRSEPGAGAGWQLACGVARVAATFALAAAYLATRRAIIGGDTLVHIYRKVENPLAFYPTRLQRLLSTFHQHWCYAALLVAPVRLSADWSYSCVPPVESLADPRNAGTAALYGSIAASVLLAAPWRFKREERLRAARVRAYIVLAFIVAPFVPAANVRTRMHARSPHRVLC